MKSTPAGQVLGYVRVSTAEQNPQRQYEAIGHCDHVYEDRESGTTQENRAALGRLIGYARAGDEVRVRSIDRLGHSTRDLFDILDRLTTKGARVRFMFEGITVATDGQPADRLFLTFLSAMVEFQQALHRDRQAAGIAIAKAKGVYRKQPALSPEDVEAVRAQADTGIPVAVIARRYSVSRQTVYQVRNGRGAYADQKGETGAA